MKFTLFSLLAAASFVASQELPTCEAGTLKCCRDVVQYSELPSYVLEYYGIDPELNDANACSDGIDLVDEFDVARCNANGESLQCCGAFVSARPPLGDDSITLNCEDVFQY
ncbi:hypothetical protein P170DRAFT_476022 [Aspergillus steynii IBT 23096]|uniref:Hydrophobin n=1 Tax=Aspergillus steynii IBT 23096 TaxID=1392250 RepID=A0A2I2GA37_9EURO|nr:uncharacterized protein P170DRAFT_476022 [Aspergillus steynii IBT 23096]PLB49735.1 hypothetical protein P170DRAFT_476022 [Aspergillus steynii IBT 23096]